MQVKIIRWLRKMVARTVMGIGGFYAAIDPEMMDEIITETQERVGNKLTYTGAMPDYEQLKKIEDEWVRNRIIN